MEKRNETVVKLAQTALMAALCFVSFTFLQIKIPLPGGDATSFHLGNTFCVLGALIGGLLAVRRIGRSTLLVGAGVGVILFLLLLLAGTLLFEEASISNGGGMMLLSCLCGGAMAGILGSRPKKKRKR